LRAREQWWQLTREGTKNAETMLERAITLDSGFSTPYAWLSYVRVQEYINEWRDESGELLHQSRDFAEKAVTLNQTDPDAHNALACAYLWLREHDKAIMEYKRTIALEPNNARAHVEIGWVLHYAGRPAEAPEPITRGMRLDPQYPDAYLHILAQVYFRLDRFEEAAGLKYAEPHCSKRLGLLLTWLIQHRMDLGGTHFDLTRSIHLQRTPHRRVEAMKPIYTRRIYLHDRLFRRQKARSSGTTFSHSRSY
jgi:tetratricopeptide (TPR) repeat protein